MVENWHRSALACLFSPFGVATGGWLAVPNPDKYSTTVTISSWNADQPAPVEMFDAYTLRRHTGAALLSRRTLSLGTIGANLQTRFGPRVIRSGRRSSGGSGMPWKHCR